MEPSSITDLLRRDHERLDELLRTAMSAPLIDPVAYNAFRGGLLRHIGIEEKILIPFARRRRPEAVLGVAKQLRLDHAALAALLVPTPTLPILETIATVLAAHNVLEENEVGGFYGVCDQLAGDSRADLLARIAAAGPVPLAAHHDGPRAFAGIERLLGAAGRAPLKPGA